MLKNHSDPSFYPSVYWFWHSVPSAEQIRSQIEEMDASGIKTFLIQARLAFPLEDYLGEEYFSAYRLAVQEASKRGMAVGIYDDYNWDSGQAGGRTVRLNGNARETHLFWTEGKIVNGVCTCSISGIHSSMYSEMGKGILDWVYEGGIPRWDEWQVYKVLAFPAKKETSYEDEVTDITAFCSIQKTDDTGCCVRVNPAEGGGLEGQSVIVFASARCETSRLINYLSPEAVDAFLQADYEPYKAHVGDYFGNTIKYMFFDHPYGGFYDWNERQGNLGNSLMFTPELAKVFRSHEHYPLEKALVSFLINLGDKTPKYRTDFFEVYGNMGRRTFFGKLSDWAKKNGLGLSGHELLAHVGAWGYTEGFPFLDARTNFAGDYFAIDGFRTQTAVDACNYHAQISARIGDSVAKAHGRRGCLIEQYAVSRAEGVPGGAGQWGLTLSEMRAQAIRHTFLGASQFIFHGYYQTDGNDQSLEMYKNPRFDFAPGLNFEPWFRKFSSFASEINGINRVIAAAKPRTSVAVLFPLRTWWNEGSDGRFSAESGKWFRYLLDHNIPFDILSEEQVELARVERGKINSGGNRYHVLIFPGVTTVRSGDLATKVESFVSNGGILLSSGGIPCNSQEIGRDEDLEKRFKALFAENPDCREFEQFPHENDLDPLFEKADVRLAVLNGKNGRPIWSWEGEFEWEPLLLVFNDQKEADHLILRVKDNTLIPSIYNMKTGARQRWPYYSVEDDGLKIAIDIEPEEVVAFIFDHSSGRKSHLVNANCPIRDIRACPGDNSIVSIISDGNQSPELLLSSVDEPEVRGKKIRSQCEKAGSDLWRVKIACDGLGENIRFSGWTFTAGSENNPQPIDITRGWEVQGFADFAGEGIYRCNFDIGDMKKAPSFELELPRVETTADVFLNGENIGGVGWPLYRFFISANRLRKTGNELMIKVCNTGANHYYHGTPFQPSGLEPSGLIGCPVLKLVTNIEIQF